MDYILVSESNVNPYCNVFGSSYIANRDEIGTHFLFLHHFGGSHYMMGEYMF
jgi:hypothetical protein